MRAAEKYSASMDDALLTDARADAEANGVTRNDHEAWAVLRRLVDLGEVPTVPTVVTAQAWRDGPRQARLARALDHCRSERVAEDLARRAGELCGRAGTSDVVDAIVIESAVRRRDDIYTGDLDDLRHLATRTTVPVALVQISR